MIRRTTIEIDEELLARAKRSLGVTTARTAVDEALRRAAEAGESERAYLAAKQTAFFERLPDRVQVDVLVSEEMWR